MTSPRATASVSEHHRNQRCDRCTGLAWLSGSTERFCGACGWHPGDPTEEYRTRRQLHPLDRTEADREVDRYLTHDRRLEGIRVDRMTAYARDAEYDALKRAHPQIRIQRLKGLSLGQLSYPDGRTLAVRPVQEPRRRRLTLKAGAVQAVNTLAADASREAVGWFSKPPGDLFGRRRIKW